MSVPHQEVLERSDFRQSTGWVDSVDDVFPGISWLCFPGVLARDEKAEDKEVRVPVATDDLRAAGVDLDLTIGRVFLNATVNLVAEQASEVMPTGFEALPPGSDADLTAWQGTRRQDTI